MGVKVSKSRYRSGFESKVGGLLDLLKANYEYEPKDKKIPYTRPESDHTYLPDFILNNGIYIETKGQLTLEDRKKHLLLKQQHPDKDIRIVLQAPSNKIVKGSKITYAVWCNKNGIRWGTISDIPAWAKEPVHHF